MSNEFYFNLTIATTRRSEKHTKNKWFTILFRSFGFIYSIIHSVIIYFWLHHTKTARQKLARKIGVWETDAVIVHIFVRVKKQQIKEETKESWIPYSVQHYKTCARTHRSHIHNERTEKKKKKKNKKEWRASQIIKMHSQFSIIIVWRDDVTLSHWPNLFSIRLCFETIEWRLHSPSNNNISSDDDNEDDDDKRLIYNSGHTLHSMGSAKRSSLLLLVAYSLDFIVLCSSSSSAPSSVFFSFFFYFGVHTNHSFVYSF